MDGRQAAKASSSNDNGARRRWRARAARRLRNLFKPGGSEENEEEPTHDEEQQFNGSKGQRSSWPGRSQQRKQEPHMVVKHTFLEFKADELEMAVRPPTRRRTKSDTQIEYGNTPAESLEPEVEKVASRANASWDVSTSASSTRRCASGDDKARKSEDQSHSKSDNESENSEERLCQVSYQISGFDASFASTADGFEVSSWPQASSSSAHQSTLQQPPHHKNMQVVATSEQRAGRNDTSGPPRDDANKIKIENSLSGSDEESENSLERGCELYVGPATNTDLFCSTVTADGFEDDQQRPGAHEDKPDLQHDLAMSGSFPPPTQVPGAYPQGVYCMGPNPWLPGSSTQSVCDDHSAATRSWSPPRADEQYKSPKGREGRIAVELDKLLSEGLVQAKPLEPNESPPPSADEQLSQQRRSQELNLRAAELDVQAARLKAAAAQAEAAAQQAWYEALATRQAEEALLCSNSSSSQKAPGLTIMARHCNSASLMARIPESFAEHVMEPREIEQLQHCPDLEVNSVRAHRNQIDASTERACSPSDRSDASQCSGERRTSVNDPDSINTTVMLRHMPCNYTREKLLSLLDTEGFNGSYDFVYLPVDFMTFQGFGYAFVNCISNAEAHHMFKHFQGFSKWPRPHTSTEEASSVCEVSWGNPLQGYEAHIDRYRNSPVMHKDVPEAFKPVAFVNGVRIKFPTPTKRIRPPRLKHGHPVDLSKSAHVQPERRAAVAPADAAGG